MLDRLKMLALVDSSWIDEMCSAGPVQRRKRDLDVIYYDKKIFKEVVTENKETIAQVSNIEIQLD